MAGSDRFRSASELTSSVTPNRSLLGRNCHADTIAGGLEFPDQALELVLAHIAARNAHAVQAARAARARTVDDHGAPRIKETADVPHLCLRREPHQRKGPDFNPSPGGREPPLRLKTRTKLDTILHHQP